MFNAMHLSRLLRNQERIVDAVKFALHVALPQPQAEQLCASIDRGDIPVPGGKSLAHAWHKLDCMSVLWERERQRHCSMHRHILADSSLKNHNNYFCVRENNVTLPDTNCMSAVVLDFGKMKYASHSWQVTTCGYGASNLAFKFRNLVHGVLLKSGTQADLDSFRNSVLSWTSDQGTERKLADCAFAVAASYDNLRNIARMVSADELPLAGPQCAQCYMWPRCLFMPGHLHIIQNALEDTVKHSSMWRSAFSDGMSAVAAILANTGLRRRFIFTCMSNASEIERLSIITLNRQLLDWRWESLGHLLDALLPIPPTLQRYWDVARMRSASEREGLSAIDCANLGCADTFSKTR